MENLAIGDILRNVVDEMHEGLQVIGRDWRYLYVNETVARQGKSTKAELMGHTMMEKYPGIDASPLFIQLKRCMEERVDAKIANEFTFPDGSKGWFDLYVHPVQEGIMILSLDVTERKRLEEELATKLEELDKITDTVVSREARMADLKQLVFRLRQLVPISDAPLE